MHWLSDELTVHMHWLSRALHYLLVFLFPRFSFRRQLEERLAKVVVPMITYIVPYILVIRINWLVHMHWLAVSAHWVSMSMHVYVIGSQDPHLLRPFTYPFSSIPAERIALVVRHFLVHFPFGGRNFVKIEARHASSSFILSIDDFTLHSSPSPLVWVLCIALIVSRYCHDNNIKQPIEQLLFILLFSPHECHPYRTQFHQNSLNSTSPTRQ